MAITGKSHGCHFKKKLRNKEIKNRKEKKRLEGKSHEEIPYQRMINII